MFTSELKDFLNVKNELKPKKGRLLLAEPFAIDDYFKRTVILITEYNDKGSTGFILNKPIKNKLEDIIGDFANFNAAISIGGPVSTDSIFYIHKLGKVLPESQPINRQLYWGGDIETLKVLIQTGAINESQIRFFIGCSGWSAGQLESELKNNFWLVSNLTPEDIFTNDSQAMWNISMSALGGKYSLWANFPNKPQYN